MRTDLQRLKRDIDSSGRSIASDRDDQTPSGSSGAISAANASSQQPPSGAGSVFSRIIADNIKLFESRPSAAARRHKAATGSVLLIGLIVAAAAAYGIYALLHHQANAPFQTFAITQLTNTGKVQETAISPDGRFLLSVQSDNGNESLWLRNIPTGSDTQVLPASGQSFASLVFSPDGNSFYFRETAGGAAGV